MKLVSQKKDDDDMKKISPPAELRTKMMLANIYKNCFQCCLGELKFKFKK
jgi:hypothetical protein